MRLVELAKLGDGHSDVERSTDQYGNPIHNLYRRRFRARWWTEFFHWVDQQTVLERGGRASNRPPRHYLPEHIEGQFDNLPPDNFPLDWFDPEQFNRLPLSTRARYTQPPRIVLPHDWRELHQRGDARWKYCSDAQLTEAYKGLFSLYHIPDASELNNRARDEVIDVDAMDVDVDAMDVDASGAIKQEDDESTYATPPEVIDLVSDDDAEEEEKEEEGEEEELHSPPRTKASDLNPFLILALIV